jgi:hypothetical protein
MYQVAGEVAKRAMENVQQAMKEAGPKSGFDIPGEASSFGARDLGKGEVGKPGSAFDGPWDQKSEARETPKTQQIEVKEPGREFREQRQSTEGDNLPDVGQSKDLDATVKGYNEEVARDSAGGEYKDVTPEDLQKKSPEEIAEARREFSKQKSELINQWEHANNREWPRYEEDVTTKDGKVIRKAGDKFDAHHVQPLELGGQNTIDNITPMHASNHHDKQGIHRSGGAYDDMVKIIREA